MGMKTVAIIGALDEEVALIAKSLTHVTHTAKGSLDIVSGTVDSFGSDVIKVAATVGGMGLVNAAATTQLLIDEIAPDAVIFSGIAGNLNTRHGFDGESMLLASGLQQSKVTAPASAEAEIIPNHQVFDAQAIDQHPGDEVLCREFGERGIEAADPGQGDALVGDQFEFFAQGRQAGGGRVRGKKFARVRLESEHGRQQRALFGVLCLLCAVGQAAQQGAMAQMHAIEVADGEHGRGRCGSVQSTQDEHLRVRGELRKKPEL